MRINFLLLTVCKNRFAQLMIYIQNTRLVGFGFEHSYPFFLSYWNTSNKRLLHKKHFQYSNDLNSSYAANDQCKITITNLNFIRIRCTFLFYDSLLKPIHHPQLQVQIAPISSGKIPQAFTISYLILMVSGMCQIQLSRKNKVFIIIFSIGSKTVINPIPTSIGYQLIK